MIGQTILHYKILAKLGEGGMGEVYLAEDTKLERKVGLKFLPLHYTTDPLVNARFQREAKAAAALNHPNIITVYEIGDHEGRAYIAMEYIDGQSLRQIMTAEESGGPALPLEQGFNIISQVCEGLTKAHQAGIVHRDLKPENIMLDADGKVKILDFGLAQMKGRSRLTSDKSTLGTIFYMSPEQCEGAAVDHRTDIWAVGVMLYEMITGKLPFGGEYETAIIYSIVNEEPVPLARHRTGVSPDLQRLIDKVLDKDSETRYQNISELLADLDRVKKSESVSAKPMSRLKKRKMVRSLARYTAFAVFFSLLTVTAFYFWGSKPSDRIPAEHKQLTFVGDAVYPAISPDGQFIAYVAGKAGEQKVMIQDMAGGDPLNVYQAKSCRNLRWSPDGTELLVRSDSTVLIPRLGGRFRSIYSHYYHCWSPDGSQIATTTQNVKWIRVTNKNTSAGAYLSLQGTFKYLVDLDWSSLGNRLLFRTRDPKLSVIWTIKIDGSQQQKVVEDSLGLSSPRWSADGKAIYYVRFEGQSQSLMKVPIAPKSGKANGPAMKILSGFPLGGYFTLSSDNKRLLYTRETSSSNLWLITLKGDGKGQTFATEQLTTGTAWAHTPAISPDGSRIAFSIGTQPRANIFVMPIMGGPTRQLTFFNSYNSGVAWSPNGNEIAFGSTQDGKTRVWKIDANGGAPHPFMKSELGDMVLVWSPGADILYPRPGNKNYHFLNPQTEEEKPLLDKLPEYSWIFCPRFSPDARSVAVAWNRDKAGLWIISLVNSSQVLIYGGWLFPIKWSADGKWIYAWNDGKKPTKILKVPIAGGQPQTMVTLPFDGIEANTTIAISPDEKQIVCPVAEFQSDVWMMESFDPESELARPITAPAWPEVKQLSYLQNGRKLFIQKKYAEAEKVFRQGLELNSEHLLLLYALGRSLSHQKKYAEAEETFQHGYRIAPENSGILNGLGYALAEQGRYTEAEAFAKKALASDSSFVNYSLMAWILVAGERDIDLGMTFAQKSFASKPGNWLQTVEIYSYFAILEHTLGLAYLKKGEHEKAVQYLQQAAAFAPERQEIRDELQVARQKVQEIAKK